MPIAAVRTVREDDDVRVIEGLGIPFGGPFAGRDSYGTFASARTNFFWGLFPDVIPGATRSDEEPRYVRPITYNHGFDAEIGLDRAGGWSPVRMDEDGVWVQAQIDKRTAYYARLGELLDANALGFSSGSAEHSVRIDSRTGEWIAWPVYELALTPTESNPYAIIASRSAETVRILEAQPDAGAAPVGPPASRTSEAASDASSATYVLSSLVYLLGDESDEAQQAFLRTAIDALQAYIAAEVAEIGTVEDQVETLLDQLTYGFMSAVRNGTRASKSETERLSGAHDAIASVLKLDCTSGDATTRSAEGPALIRLMPATEDPNAQLAGIVDLAVRSAAEEAVARLTGGKSTIHEGA